jgi:hypothetical protein
MNNREISRKLSKSILYLIRKELKSDNIDDEVA